MIKVTAVNYLKEECVDDFLALSKELVEKTNALDKGCIKYELCRAVNDPLKFIMLEEWENQESLDAHLKAGHFTSIVPKFGQMTSKPSDLTMLEKVY